MRLPSIQRCRNPLFGLLSLLVMNIALAQQPETNGGDSLLNHRQLIENEAAAFANEMAELATRRKLFEERSAQLSTRPVDQAELEQTGLIVDARKVALKTIELSIKSTLQARTELVAKIRALEDQLQLLGAVERKDADKPLIAQTRTTLNESRALLELEQRRMEQLERRRKLGEERIQLAERWHEVIREAYRSQQDEARKLSLDELEKELLSEQQKWQEKATEYRLEVNRLGNEPSTDQSVVELAEARLAQAEESVFLINIRLKTARMQSQFDRITERVEEATTELRVLNSDKADLQSLRQQLDSMSMLVNSKLKLLQQRREVNSKALELEPESRKGHHRMLALFDELIAQFDKRIADLNSFGALLDERIAKTDQLLLERKKRGLTERHTFPRSLAQWEALVVELTRLPDKMIQVGRNILFSLVVAKQQSELEHWSLLLLLCLGWSAFCLSLGRLKPPDTSTHDQSFTRRSLMIGTALIRANRFSLLLGGVLLIAGWMLDIVDPGLAIIAILFSIWLGARLIIGISWWVLNSPLGIEERQPGLFRLITFFTILISLATLGLALGILDLASQPLKELFERLFMLLLLPPAYLALRIHKLWYGLLRERKGTTQWVRLAGLVGMAIPLAIAATALIGLFGYINLALNSGRYLAIFFAVVIGWMIARGLVMDLAKSVENSVARRSQRSGFWVKSLIEPVQYMIRLALFLIAIWLLYQFFLQDPTTGVDLRDWLSHTLFTFGEKSINSLDLLGAILLLLLVFYLGRWAREITYGWAYARIRDIGIRNSLSVFTQYAVVVIGLLIALNVIGINLTSLTVFAGALGVGIGFGMQNIANNFISGLILLAERPVRTADWVTIGDKEGTVAAIGMRSVTVTTWDNQDVIIPNSDLISNSFINWTRTDAEVRTVLLVGVSYHADPHLARQVILDAVTKQPEVSLTPRPPQVWLIDFGASSVNFRVQYFTDVVRFSRLELQSKVLFAIWDALKEAGIGIPFPQQDVYIKEWPDRQQEPPA